MTTNHRPGRDTRKRAASRAGEGANAGRVAPPPRWLRWLARDFTIITLVYSAAWFLMLLNGGRYWDDWCMVKMSFPTARLMGSMIGQVWQPLYWMMLSWVPGANYIAHGLIFFGFLASALLLNRILREIPGVDRAARVLIACLFAVFPVNGARFALVDFQYTASIVMFYVAWYLIAIDLRDPRLWRRVVSAALFLLAAITTNSLMMFIAVVPVYMVLARREVLRDLSAMVELGVRYRFILAIPLLALLLRSTVLKPWGLYANYNVIKLKSLIRVSMLHKIWDTMVSSVLEPLATQGWLVVLVSAALFAFLCVCRIRFKSSARTSLAIFAAGVIALALGVAPYVAVGKIPQAVGTDYWDSRHQLLVPLGAALVLYAVAGLLGRVPRIGRVAGIALVSVLLSISVVNDVRMSLAFQTDWYKQVSLMEQIEQSSLFADTNIISFHDTMMSYNANGRRYQPYEYTGMMFEVFGNAARFGSDDLILNAWMPGFEAHRKYRQYHYWETLPPHRLKLLILQPGSTDLSKDAVRWSLVGQQVLAPTSFRKRVHDIVLLEAVPQ